MGSSAATRNATPHQAPIIFDAETFKKLVARFDSNHTGEAETAFRKAMLVCVQAQLRFCDAAAEAYAQNSRAAELEAELANVSELLSQRETQGAALADARDRLEQEFASYRHTAEQEIARLKQTAQNPYGPYCRGCELKRAALALIAGWPIAKFWFAHSSTLAAFLLSDAQPWRPDVFGALLASLPFLAVLCRWVWLLFKRRYRWLSWRDNMIYRRIAAAWNALLQRLTMP